MNHILLIRHAETDLKGTFCGHTDPPLNQNAQTQLQILMQTLQAHPITSIYSSDLQRARSTAQAIADRDSLPFVSTPDLREIHFGDWEGLTWAEIEQRDPTRAQQWIDRHPHLPAPNGETYEAFQSRVLKAFDTIHAASSPGTTAIVSHAGVMQLLLTTRCGWSRQQAYEHTRSYACVIPLRHAERLA